MKSTHRGDHAIAARPGGGASGSRVEARRSSRSRARCTADRWISSGCSCGRRLASGTRDGPRPPAGRHTAASAAARPHRASRSRPAVARGHDPRAGGWPDSAFSTRVQLAAQGTRDLPRLDLEQCPGRPDPAQEGPDRLAVLRGRRRRDRGGSATTPGARTRLSCAPAPVARRDRPRTRGGAADRPGSAIRVRGTVHAATPRDNGRPMNARVEGAGLGRLPQKRRVGRRTLATEASRAAGAAPATCSPRRSDRHAPATDRWRPVRPRSAVTRSRSDRLMSSRPSSRASTVCSLLSGRAALQRGDDGRGELVRIVMAAVSGARRRPPG